jgi:hypothetical protein
VIEVCFFDGIGRARVEVIDRARIVEGIDCACGVDGTDCARIVEGIDCVRGIDGTDCLRIVEGIDCVRGVDGADWFRVAEGIELLAGDRSFGDIGFAFRAETVIPMANCSFEAIDFFKIAEGAELPVGTLFFEDITSSFVWTVQLTRERSSSNIALLTSVSPRNALPRVRSTPR